MLPVKKQQYLFSGQVTSQGPSGWESVLVCLSFDHEVLSGDAQPQEKMAAYGDRSRLRKKRNVTSTQQWRVERKLEKVRSRK